MTFLYPEQVLAGGSGVEIFDAERSGELSKPQTLKLPSDCWSGSMAGPDELETGFKCVINTILKQKVLRTSVKESAESKGSRSQASHCALMHLCNALPSLPSSETSHLAKRGHTIHWLWL